MPLGAASKGSAEVVNTYPSIQLLDVLAERLCLIQTEQHPACLLLV